MKLFGWLVFTRVSAADVRAEIWRLGGRHQGEPLKGALKELKAPDITPERTTLLNAVVQQLRAA